MHFPFTEYHLAYKNVSSSPENIINMQNSLLAYKEIASLCRRLKETNFSHAAVQYLMRDFNLLQLRLHLSIHPRNSTIAGMH